MALHIGPRDIDLLQVEDGDVVENLTGYVETVEIDDMGMIHLTLNDDPTEAVQRVFGAIAVRQIRQLTVSNCPSPFLLMIDTDPVSRVYRLCRMVGKRYDSGPTNMRLNIEIDPTPNSCRRFATQP